MRTVVIGSGSWGTALAQVLQDNHQEVLVYGVAAVSYTHLRAHET